MNDSTQPVNPPHVQSGYRFAVIPEWVLYHPELSATAVRLYGALARHGMTPETCYPSHARLAKLIGVSERSVQAPIRDLERVGALRRVERWIDERQTSNGYQLAGDTAFTDVPPAQENVPPPAQENVGGGALRNAPKENKSEREPEERENPAPRAASADVTLFAVPNAEPAVPNTARQMAKLILDDWWSRQHPKPQQKYVAILGVLTKALEGGWDERDLREALDTVPTISGTTLDYWRNTRQRNGRKQLAYGTGSKPAHQLADEAIHRLADLMGYDQ